MSISTEVNIDVLNEVYVLSAFHGLRASHPNDEWNDQMTEETESYLPNSDVYLHNDAATDDDANAHVKANPVLEAMQRAVAPGGPLESPHNETDKNHKPTLQNNGQLDHDSLIKSDFTTTPPHQSSEDPNNLYEYVSSV